MDYRQPEYTRQKVGVWAKFSLLMWKNMLLVWRRKWATILEVLVPVVFAGLLVLIRSLQMPTVYDEPFDYNSLSPIITEQFYWLDGYNLAYAPQHPALLPLMARVKESMAITEEFQIYATPEEMNTALVLDDTRSTLAGIIFEGLDAAALTLPDDLHAIIRFPAELRSLSNPMALIDNWQTNSLFPFFSTGGPRNHKAHTGGRPPGYFEERFTTVQSAISQAFVEIKAEQEAEDSVLRNLLVKRFPEGPRTIDDLLFVMQLFVGLIMFLGFLYPAINNVKMITVEKEKQLKEAMKIMGLPSALHWTAWFVKIMIFQMITVSLMMVMLNVSWYDDSNISVFTNSNWFAVWTFLMSYITAITTFCFMMSVLFTKANTAATITGLMWFIFSAPYNFTQPNYETMSLAAKMLVCLFHNTGMSYGFLLIFTHEGNGEGLQWSNYFQPTSIDDNFTVGHVTMTLLLAALLYLLIALYVEQVFPGEFGVPRKWYFPIEKLLCLNQDKSTDIESVNQQQRGNREHFEADPENKNAGIRTKSLRKVYSNKKVAVEGLSISMYDDEITVLLGDNGAGKTTTMSMLTGMFPPSSGTATINGSDIRTNIDGVRESIGLCPQHNILFDELTVREHIIFFSKLKGLSKTDAEIEAKRYVKLLELEPKTNSASKTLSGGMKRKLSVGVALCGGSKVVLCDEPTSGMDPAARRALWDLLQMEKRGRTILLSTHFMDEADVLGDRIAIMHQGEMKCYGSSFFLKKAFGTGYELICEKGFDCDVDETTRLIQEFIPDVTIDSNVGSELSYKMDSKYSRLFQPMLKTLEDNSEQLDINGYGISQTTLEEVFLKVTAGKSKSVHGQSTLSRLSEKRYQDAAEKLTTMSMHSGQGESLEQLRGGNFFWSQIKAMTLKKTLYTWRNWILFLVQVIIPVVLTIITVMIARTFAVSESLRDLPINMDMYLNNPILLLSNEVATPGSSGSALVTSFEAMFQNPPTERTLEVLPAGQTIRDYVIGLTNQELITFNARTLVGVTIQDDNVLAWFNNQPYHTIPLSLNLAYNAFLRTVCTQCSLSITNSPLPFTPESRLEMLQAGNNMGFQLASNIGFSMAFVAAFYIIFYIKERVSRAKLLQFVSGINIWTFWLTAFVWDIITFVITTCFMVVTLLVFQEDGWSTGPEVGRVLILSVCFVWAVLPFVYLFSLLFEIPSSGFIKFVMVGIFLGVAIFYTVFTLSVLERNNVADGITWGFLIVPHFALISGLDNLNRMNTAISICSNMCDNFLGCTSMDQMCGVGSLGDTCCVTEYFAWSAPGILRNIIFMLAAGVLFMAILFMIEFRVFHNIFYKFKPRPKGLSGAASATDVAALDGDVVQEKHRVRNMNFNQIRSTNLVVKNMTKFYKNFLAVNQICVGVDAGECFGLLGVNGAGKTSTFKMLTGDETLSGGEAWVRGVSIKTDMKEIYKNIGYCPQFDALLEDLTGRETLKIFALLRGIHPDYIEKITTKLATDFNYMQHIDKKTKEYSGGNKRKLSTSLALLGNPSVVYLDEPTTGMDPGAKRLLWEVMSRYRASGKSIILTSHSMEECEALCTRLSIMVNGEFKCLGSTQNLKNKFSKGYLLIVQMNRQANSIGGQFIDPRAEMERVKRFVEANLLGAVLKEEYQGRMSYYIPTGGMKWSTMFGIMETGKEQFNIESYSLSQTSLEQVFLSFTKYQREETRN